MDVARISCWLLLLLLCERAYAEPAGEAVWMARTDQKTALWVQVHPSGHAWLQLRSLNESAQPLAVEASLEVALRLTPEAYRALRAELEKIGLKPGLHAVNQRVQLGIAPLPHNHTHELAIERSWPLAAAFERAVAAGGVDPCGSWSELMDNLRRVGLDCVGSARAKAQVSFGRAAGGGLELQELTGAVCLVSSPIRAALDAIGSDKVDQIRFDVLLRSRRAFVDLAFDPSVPLLIDGRQPKRETGLDIPRWDGSVLYTTSPWKQEVVWIQPAAKDTRQGALVNIGRHTALYFHRDLWGADLSIDFSAVRGSRKLVDSSLASHGRQIVRCRGAPKCAELTIEELRGLTAAAWAQCKRLQKQRVHVSSKWYSVTRKTGLSTKLVVKVGASQCALSLARSCVRHADQNEGLWNLLDRLTGQPRAGSTYDPPFDMCSRAGNCGVMPDEDDSERSLASSAHGKLLVLGDWPGSPAVTREGIGQHKWLWIARHGVKPWRMGRAELRLRPAHAIASAHGSEGWLGGSVCGRFPGRLLGHPTRANCDQTHAQCTVTHRAATLSRSERPLQTPLTAGYRVGDGLPSARPRSSHRKEAALDRQGPGGEEGNARRRTW